MTYSDHLNIMKQELDQLEVQGLNTVIDLFNQHSRIIFCTMGKSAFACAKIVYTARSYGLDWHDLDVCHAFHGDAGLIKSGDLLVFVSKSGETQEVLDVARYFDQHTRIGVSSHAGSQLSEICDANLIIPVLDEGSPFGYAPMTSTTLYMIVLHGVLCETIENAGISLEEYARNHPGGSIGRQLDQCLAPRNGF